MNLPFAPSRMKFLVKKLRLEYLRRRLEAPSKFAGGMKLEKDRHRRSDNSHHQHDHSSHSRDMPRGIPEKAHTAENETLADCSTQKPKFS
ncbi:hypothetical protein Trydic_g16305 [Trypoxylus dichotomus]